MRYSLALLYAPALDLQHFRRRRPGCLLVCHRPLAAHTLNRESQPKLLIVVELRALGGSFALLFNASCPSSSANCTAEASISIFFSVARTAWLRDASYRPQAACPSARARPPTTRASWNGRRAARSRCASSASSRSAGPACMHKSNFVALLRHRRTRLTGRRHPLRPQGRAARLSQRSE